MQTNHEIFMLVAEEMSISKAAERAFVTQQCVSDHIKRLEQQHNIKLFTRRPRFQLTPAGEAMLQSLRNIKILENNMYSNLHQMSTGIMGTFTVGISASRAQVILPRVLPQYYSSFPNVKVAFSLDDTIIMEEKLLKGKIDLFVGINAHIRKEFCIIPLCNDEICLIISDSLLKHHFGEQTEKILHSEADLSQFSEIPFTESYKTGAINQVMQQYLDDNHISLKKIYSISDSDTQISLCASGLCASLCPKMLLARVSDHNLFCSPSQFIHILPLKGLQQKLRVEIIHHKNVFQPIYIKKFIEVLKKQMAQ